MLPTGHLLAPLNGTLLLRFGEHDLSTAGSRASGLGDARVPGTLGYAIRFSFHETSELLDSQLHACNFRKRALAVAL